LSGRLEKGLKMERAEVSEEGVERSGGDGGGVILGDLTGRWRGRCDAETLGASGASRRAGGELGGRGLRTVVREGGRRRFKHDYPMGRD
jgi:hypothetical protein